MVPSITSTIRPLADGSSARKKFKTFRDVAELRAYTKEAGKIFRNTFNEEVGNVVLKHLLQKIF
jgi:hypothetical protein